MFTISIGKVFVNIMNVGMDTEATIAFKFIQMFNLFFLGEIHLLVVIFAAIRGFCLLLGPSNDREYPSIRSICK
jgi:hypothetical protein